MNTPLRNSTSLAVHFLAAFFSLIFLPITGQLASAQSAPNTYQAEIGKPNWAVKVPVPDGFVNVANGNLHIEIPISSTSQRNGKVLVTKFEYDSALYQHSGSRLYPGIVGNDNWEDGNPGNQNNGWKILTTYDGVTGSLAPYGGGQGGVSSDLDFECLNSDDVSNSCWETYGPFYWTSIEGDTKTFRVFTTQSYGAGTDAPTAQGMPLDLSPYFIQVTDYSGGNVYDLHGNEVDNTPMDHNGNYITVTDSGELFDELGRVPVKESDAGNVRYYDSLTSSGETARTTVTTQRVDVHTSFYGGSQEENEFIGQLKAIQSLVLPNGTYTFGYDSGTDAGTYGLLKSLTLPSGGTVQFTYSNFTDNLQNVGRWLTGVNINGNSWTFTPSLVNGGQQVIVTKPSGDSETYSFVVPWGGAVGAWVYHAAYLSASGAVQKTEQYSYTGMNMLPSEVITTIPSSNGSVSKDTQYDYGDSSQNNVTEVREWDWYSGSSSPSSKPSRIIDATYSMNVPAYAALGIYSNPLSISLRDGLSGAIVAQTSFEYDNYTKGISASGTVQHDNTWRFVPSYTLRGNVTATSVWRNTDNTWIQTNRRQYDDAGNVIESDDAKGNPTYYSYADSWSESSCHPSTWSSDGWPSYTWTSTPGAGAAYPTSITNAIGQASTSAYNSCTGSVGWQKGVNLQGTAYQTTYHYDAIDRTIEVDYPDGGQVTTVFNDNAPQSITQTTLQSNTPSLTKIVQATILDNLGRPSQTQALTDPNGESYIDTTYDQNGRKASVSNPYRSTSDSTYGTTSYQYDGLDRVIAVTRQPDNSQVTTNYSGAFMTVTDGAKRQHKTQMDAFGNILSVWEDPNGLNYETDYTYDALNNLTSVVQWGGIKGGAGARLRSFTFNSLSQLMVASNPESGTICYGVWSGSSCINGYDLNGNLTHKTDARGITTTIVYDQLNRVLSKSYSNDASKTPWACFQYDSSILGIGKLANQWTQPASTGACPTILPSSGYLTKRSIVSYDPMGRPLSEQQCTPANCTGSAPYTPAYTYDLAGHVWTSTNGIAATAGGTANPLTFTNIFDGAGRLQSLTGNWNDPTHPSALFNSQFYFAHGGLGNALLGNGAVNMQRIFDSRLRVTGETDTGSAVLSGTSGTAVVAISGAEQK